MPGTTDVDNVLPEAKPSLVMVVMLPVPPATPVPVKANVPVVPTVALRTTIVPRLVLTNVQVTVSPGATTTAPTDEPSSHDDVVSQPATGVSATAYVPGTTTDDS